VQQRQRVQEAGRGAVADLHAHVADGVEDRPQGFTANTVGDLVGVET
jgi:hypothetical protein